MKSPIQTGTWVVLGEGVAASYVVDAKNELVTFTFEDPGGGSFTVVVTPEPLRQCAGAFPAALADLVAGLAEIESAGDATLSG
jgi:hypothetical protein